MGRTFWSSLPAAPGPLCVVWWPPGPETDYSSTAWATSLIVDAAFSSSSSVCSTVTTTLMLRGNNRHLFCEKALLEHNPPSSWPAVTAAFSLWCRVRGGNRTLCPAEWRHFLSGHSQKLVTLPELCVYLLEVTCSRARPRYSSKLALQITYCLKQHQAWGENSNFSN